MPRRTKPGPSNRAQWFSELLVALNEAERLLAILEAGDDFHEETVRLRRRVQQLALVARREGRVISSSWPDAPTTPTVES